jgi:lipoate-protein ligase A
METWDLHLDGAADGRYNMAKDGYLLRRACATGRPALRLYAWERPTLSVGRAQRVDAQIDLAACLARGIPVVRRATGGRAVLHGTDVTYSVAAPLDGTRFSGGIMDIYRELSGAFVRFFRQLGLEPEVKAYSRGERASQASAVCFSTPSAFEILLGQRKILGSAQRLQAGGFLQHGSLPLLPQADLLAGIFRDASARELSAQMTDLQSEGCWPGAGLAALHGGIVRAFAQAFGAELTPAPWGAGDAAAVDDLLAAYPWLAPPEAPARPAQIVRQAP